MLDHLLWLSTLKEFFPVYKLNDTLVVVVMRSQRPNEGETGGEIIVVWTLFNLWIRQCCLVIHHPLKN